MTKIICMFKMLLLTFRKALILARQHSLWLAQAIVVLPSSLVQYRVGLCPDVKSWVCHRNLFTSLSFQTLSAHFYFQRGCNFHFGPWCLKEPAWKWESRLDCPCLPGRWCGRRVRRPTWRPAPQLCPISAAARKVVLEWAAAYHTVLLNFQNTFCCKIGNFSACMQTK